MSFDDQINRMIQEEEVPECLLPENIALMLKEKTAKREKPQPVISVKSKHRAIAVRTVAALAACAALTVGVVRLSESRGVVSEGENPVKTDGLMTGAADYSAVYRKMTDIIVNFSTVSDSYSELDNPNPPSEGKQPTTTMPETIIQNPEAMLEYGVLSAAAEGVAEADMIKTDGTNLYYTVNHALYVIRSDGGDMTVLHKIERDGSEPFEMYLTDGRLMVLSESVTEVPYETGKPAEETLGEEPASPEASGEGIPVTVQVKQTLVEIYDISDKENPVLTKTYKQSGGYSASRMIGNYLYLVTDYSRYQTKPLSEETDLDNYIPAYYLDDEKMYVQAENIYLPENIKSTGYSVIGGLDVLAEQPIVSVQAVLGAGKIVSCSAGNLYLAAGTWSQNGKDSSAVTKFSLENGKAEYLATAGLNGQVWDASAVDEYDSMLRLAVRTTNSKGQEECVITILDASLKPIGSFTVANGKTQAVRFSKDRAYVMQENADLPLEISLEDPAAPRALEGNADGQLSAFLLPYDDSCYLGLSRETDEAGNPAGLRLSMFAADGTSLSEQCHISFSGELSGLISKSIINRKTLFADSQSGLIGIPAQEDTAYGTRNLYYLFAYDEAAGLTQKGMLEYSDIDDSGVFQRGVLSGDMFYAFSRGRIVSLRLSDMKVVEAMTIE